MGDKGGISTSRKSLEVLQKKHGNYFCADCSDTGMYNKCVIVKINTWFP